MLIRNFFRDIFSTLPRLLAVIIITALGVMIYVGMSGYGYNLTKVADTYYKSQNVADYWIYGSQFTKLDEKQIAKLDYVESIQSEISIPTEDYQDENISIDLSGVSGDFNINKPYIISGRMFESNRECMLDASYAKAHNINLDDKIELRIKEMEKKLTFTVCALIDSPENVYNVGGMDLIPNSNKHGFAYVKEDALGEMKEIMSYNKITLKVGDNTDKDKLKVDLEKILGTKLNQLLSFDNNQKASIIISEVKNTKAIASILPMIFFLIAAFIMFTTMSRVVENNRMMIGTLKAFGYSKIVIFNYFFSYAFIVVILGNLVGALSSSLITSSMLNMATGTMTMPKIIVSFDFLSIFKSVMITTIICCGTAAFICAREIRYSPAECMRPKSPKVGRVNFIERIKFIWASMNFEEKTIARNIFRNKMRLIMCVLGVSGCMAIIITAFGFRDTTGKLMVNMFSNMYKYDIQVIFKNDTSILETERIKKLASVDKAESVMSAVIKVSNGSKSESSTISVMEDKISLMVPSMEAMDSMVMPSGGVIASTFLAKKLNIHEGDIIDLVVSGEDDIRKVKVVSIKDNITGCYVSRSLWRKIGEEYTPSYIYINTKDPTSFIENTKKYDFILAVNQKSELVDSINSQMSAMNTIAFILIVFGGVLALVVLYNLGILNFYERMRELATLKVLGFMNKEIKTLVLRENTIFTIIGIIIGMPMGVGLTTFIMNASAQEDMTFSPYIKGVTFLYAAGLTFMFSIFVNMLLSKKLKQIDMLGALKSIE
ncbi:ABC transporter permease [Clostridium sp.]